MQPFAYARADSLAMALHAIAGGAQPLAGGTELVNWMRHGLAAPERLVDIGRVPELQEVRLLAGGGLRLGAGVTLARLADDAALRQAAPALAEAAAASASTQVRHRATLGGNLLQQTRCGYYRHGAGACNRRTPGSGCAALEGLNDAHAVLGWNAHCVATDASDPAVALAALDAVLVLQSQAGERRLPVAALREAPRADDAGPLALRIGELITAIELPPAAGASGYLKLRERASFEFARVSVAARLRCREGRVAEVAIALGGVAHKAWRLPALEARLVGTPATPEAWRGPIRDALAEARPLAHNADKQPLAANAIVRLLTRLVENA